MTPHAESRLASLLASFFTFRYNIRVRRASHYQLITTSGINASFFRGKLLRTWYILIFCDELPTDSLGFVDLIRAPSKDQLVRVRFEVFGWIASSMWFGEIAG